MRGFLGLRYRSIGAAAGMLLVPAGCAIALPSLIALARPAEAGLVPWFAGTGMALATLGVALCRLGRSSEPLVLSVQEGAVVVVAAWVVACVVGAVPLVPGAGLRPIQALFESVSGWTTTGLAMVDVDRSPWMVLLYRSVLQLVGGAGFVVFALTVVLGPQGTGLPTAEGRQDQLVPNARRSARLVGVLYGGYALAGAVAFRVAGMGWFEAVNHALAAVSTGGFSTSSGSIGAWSSPAVEATCIVLMLVGSTSFATAWLAVTGRWTGLLRTSEVRFVAAAAPVGALTLWATFSSPAASDRVIALRTAIFEAVSALTTSGFSTTTYAGWPSAAILVLVILMAIGGGAGSTAGGIKQHRVIVLATALLGEMRRRRLPSGAVIVSLVWSQGRRVRVDDAEVRATAVFVWLYVGVLVLGTLVLCVSGFSLQDSLFEFASALGTVGLSVGVTSAATPDSATIAMILAMFLGRLEFFVVFVAAALVASDAAGLSPRLFGRRRQGLTPSSTV